MYGIYYSFKITRFGMRVKKCKQNYFNNLQNNNSIYIQHMNSLCVFLEDKHIKTIFQYFEKNKT